MNRTQTIGLIVSGTGYLVLGFFWGGPGFLHLTEQMAVIGLLLAVLLGVVGVALFIAGTVRRKKS